MVSDTAIKESTIILRIIIAILRTQNTRKLLVCLVASMIETCLMQVVSILCIAVVMEALNHISHVYRIKKKKLITICLRVRCSLLR